MEWYYAKDDQQHGPVPEAELYRLARSGELSPDDLIWNPAMGDRWAPASTFPDLFERRPPALSAHPPAAAPPPHAGGPVENAEITRRARASLEGRWGLAIGVTLVYGLLTNLPSSASEDIGWLVELLIEGPLQVGIATFFLNLTRNRPAEFPQLFEGFRTFGNALGAYLLTTLFILLWSLLLIIPGIIAALSYAMAFYILADSPELGPMDAISRSKRIMDGHKWRLFCLGFRFLGWILLSVFLTLGIGLLWVFPYMAASFAQFYETVRDDWRTL